MVREVKVSEEEAQSVLLVKAFEEADPEGELLPLSRRQAASSGSPGSAGDGGSEDPVRRVVSRALALRGDLDEALPSLATLRKVTRLAAGALPVVLAVAFAVGLSTSALGPARSINLLSIPLLGLIAWNLLLYLVFALVWVLRGWRGGRPSHGIARLVAPLLTLGTLRRLRGAVRERIPEAGARVGKALGAYLRDWRRVSAPLVEARSRRLFHGGALALMAGILAGMYARGLIFEYQATWESTFLDAEGARRLLATVLAPALVVSGIPLPPLPVEGGRGDAAPWIHLFAVTGALLVLAPRGLLMLIETARVLRLRGRLPLALAGAYFRRILAAGRGDRLRITVLPYSTTVSPRNLEKLHTALLDLYGSRASIRTAGRVEYGGAPPPEEPGGGELTLPVVIFGLAQTPETEVHGDFLAELRKAAPEAPECLVVLDTSSYRARLGKAPNAEERLSQRLHAWERVLREMPARVAVLDLALLAAEEIHRQLTRAAEGDSGWEETP